MTKFFFNYLYTCTNPGYNFHQKCPVDSYHPQCNNLYNLLNLYYRDELFGGAVQDEEAMIAGTDEIKARISGTDEIEAMDVTANVNITQVDTSRYEAMYEEIGLGGDESDLIPGASHVDVIANINLVNAATSNNQANVTANTTQIGVVTNTNHVEEWLPICDEIILKPRGDLFAHIVSSLSFNDLLAFTYLLYLLGLFGLVYNHKNFFITMLSIELMYLGIITSYITISISIHDPKGHIFALFFLIIAATESAIGLSLLVALHWFGRSLKFNAYTELRG